MWSPAKPASFPSPTGWISTSTERRPSTAPGAVQGEHWQAPAELDKEFHTYGLEWSDKRILFFFDGRLVHGWSNTHHHYPLVLRLSIAADYCGMPLAGDLPSAFEIDYVRAWQRTDVADTRIWDFQFALPDESRRYRVPTTDGGTLVLFKGGERNLLKVDYLNPAFFNAQTEPVVKKTVIAVDRDGKPVHFHFEWRFSVVDTEHNGYAPYRIDI